MRNFKPRSGGLRARSGGAARLVVLGLLLAAWSGRADTLISTGAVWKYLDNGSNQSNAWRAVDFDDSAWTNGPAQLGFGDGDEARVINGGPSTARFITIYFRRAFLIEDASIFTNLFVRLLRDDGGVVYLNGVEIFRSNMPGGAITYTTLAPASVPAADETTNFYQTNVSVALLLAGTNVIAAEIHQNGVGSSDLSFDLELLANLANTAPVVSLTNPPNNALFRAGTNVTLGASATDPGGTVARVEFFEGENRLGEDTSSPFSLVWSNVALGAYNFRVVATDNFGAASTSAPVNIMVVSNVPPLVAITSPTNKAALKAGTNVTLAATATDADGRVDRVEFFVADTSLGVDTNSPFSFVVSNVVVGSYQFTAVAIDNDGVSVTSAVVNVIVATNLLPTVALTAPTNAPFLGGPGDITLRATATDADGTVARVEFFEGATLLGQDTSTPYSLIWSNVPLGSYTLTAVATDNNGASRTSAPLTITVINNVPPTASITAPTNSAFIKAGTNLTINATATDNDGLVSRVEFFQGTNKLGQDLTGPFSLVWSNVPAGTYALTVVATDNAYAGTTSAPVNIFVVTNLPPNVAITSPTNNAIFGGPLDITATATASDPDGTVVLVEFYEGANWLGGDPNAPFSVVWSNAVLGDFILTAVATDNFGAARTSAPVSVTIRSNVLPVVNLTAPTNNLVVKAGTNLTLTATASDSDGSVRQVEFFASDASVGVDTNSPYSLVWSNAPFGDYTLTAVATDNSGHTRTSAPVTLFVVTNFAPAVAITAPTNNAALGGPAEIMVMATATDSDGTVSLVEFFEGANKIGDDADAPFTVIWSSVALGDFILTAIATDNSGGARTSAPVAVSIRTNALPTVSITNPRTNALISIQSNVVITVTAADNDGGVRLVEFYEDGNKLGEDATAPYSLAVPLAAGAYVLRAVATDIAGAGVTSAPVQITVVTNLLPTVAITNPPNNALLSAYEPLTLRATAADSDGAIARVEFLQGYAKIGESFSAPHMLTLSNLTPGAYVFRARAVDNSGDAVTSAPVNVTLHNRRPLVPAGSVWKFLDNGSNQSNAWRAVNYDDSAWSSGRAQLGYGDGDEATVVSFGTNSSAKYITTYFRRAFELTNAAEFSSLVVRLLRDDGGVVYLNGAEVFRQNLPAGEILFTTAAAANVDDPSFYQANVPPALLLNGTNVVAVEIHQSSATSSDISFDLDLSGGDTLAITRGPYLQLGTPTSIIVRWRTSAPLPSRVFYGSAPDALTQLVGSDAPTNEHSVTLTGLAPDTTYYYAVASATETLAAGLDHTFTTSPPPGTAKATRVWVLGDSGTGFPGQYTVRDAYYSFTGPRPTDLWLMLGDNVYDNGLDEEYQARLFDAYPTMLRQSVLWPTVGNHDTANLTNVTETIPYFRAFTMPTNSEAGGVPSGTERYYSFDYANIHFVSLDSQTSDRSATGPMANWLRRDLAANTSLWTVVTFHHPPYTKGANNSDTPGQLADMRVNFVPILEANDVDLVLTGHSHDYERSFLMDGHYGVSSTFAPAHVRQAGNGRPDGDGIYYKTNVAWRHGGAVYVVAGSSGRLDSPPLNHPAMFYAVSQLGSLVLDIQGERLDLKFLRETGAVEDYFSMIKVRTPNFPPLAVAGQIAVNEDGSRTLSLGASDVNGDPLSFTILTAPANGVLRVTGGGANPPITNGTPLGGLSNLTYRPNPDFHGTDSFTFKVNDGALDSGAAVIVIAVNPVNDAPVAFAQTVAVAEDTPRLITLAVADPDGDMLTYTITAPVHGTLTGPPPNLTYRPHADYHGSDSFTFKVSDGQADSAEQMVSITVAPVNDAPVAYSQAVSLAEDTSIPIALTGFDAEDHALAFAVTPPSHGTLTGVAPDLVYQPAPNFHGADRFTFRVHDGASASVVATVEITVISVNDSPVFLPPESALSVDEDQPLLLLPDATDADGDALLFITSAPGHGSLFALPPFLMYLPDRGYHGPDSFTVKASDGALESVEAEIFITVNPVNDAPLAYSEWFSVLEDTPLAIMLRASDPDGDALTYTVTPPAHGRLSGTPPHLTYRPAADFRGWDTFTFQAHDGQSDSVIANVRVSVLPVNDPPVADAGATPLRRVISPNNLNAKVVLDASRTRDPDDESLQFAWLDGGAASPFARGMVAVTTMTVGAHAVTLRVGDGMMTDTDQLPVTVITAAEAAREIIALVQASGLTEKIKRPLVSTLESAADNFVRTKMTAGVTKLLAFQDKVRTTVARTNPTLAEDFIRAAQRIMDVFAPTAPAQLRSCVCLPGHTMRLSGTGSAGKVYLIEATTDMARWEAIGSTVAGDSGVLTYEDTDAARWPCRFYRLAVPE